jgi:hypothetical protein
MINIFKLSKVFLLICFVLMMGLFLDDIQIEAFASNCEAIELTVEDDNLYLEDYLQVEFITSLTTEKIGIGYGDESDSIDKTWTSGYKISGDLKIWDVEVKMEYDGRQRIVFWAGDHEGWCSARDITIDVEEKRPLADVPQNIRATATTYSVTLRWDAVEGANDYTVRLNGVNRKTDRLTYIYKDLLPDEEYSYAVRSNNLSGSSEFSPAVSIVTEDSLGPDIPENVKAFWMDDEITVRWDEVEYAEDYTVSFNDDTFNTENKSYTFDNITTNKDYDYAVCANNDLGSSRYSKTMTIDKDSIPEPGIPKDIKVTAGEDAVILRWSSVYGADDYTVILNGEKYTTNRTLYTFKDLKPGKEYEYGVRANNPGGYGEYSPMEKIVVDEDGDLVKLKYLGLSDWAMDNVKNIDENDLITDELLDELLYEPGAVLTRAEFCEMLVQLYDSYAVSNDVAIEYDPLKSKNFIDLDNLDVRTQKSILKANALGIVKGISDSKFDPESTITREMMAVMIQNTHRSMCGNDIDTISKEWILAFDDVDAISQWALDGVRFANSLGILKGDGRNFLPGNEANHEMGLTLLNRSFKMFVGLSIE